MELHDILKNGALNYNIDLDDDRLQKFMLYKDLLKEWNEKVNLTAITDDKEIITKHFLDSLAIFKSNKINKGISIIDVGTGAGFPGLPIGIVMPENRIVLADSLNKRLKFLDEVSGRLELNNIVTIHGRAEDLGRNKDLREKFDIATARAVANMSVLSEYCLPFVKKGGYFIALKGPSIEEEISQSKNAVATLGGKIVEVIEADIYNEEYKHKIVIVEKTKECPNIYPRKAGTVEKKPIR